MARYSQQNKTKNKMSYFEVVQLGSFAADAVGNERARRNYPAFIEHGIAERQLNNTRYYQPVERNTTE